MSSCSFDGCSRDTVARGLCSAHYQQYRAGVELHQIGHRPARTCTYPGCDKRHYSHGLCRGHCSQIERGVPLRPLGTRPPRAESQTCTVTWRDRPHKAKGLCNAHYQKQYDRKKTKPRKANSKPRTRRKKNQPMPDGWLKKTKTPSRKKPDRYLPPGWYIPCPEPTPEEAALAARLLKRHNATDIAETLGLPGEAK